MVVREGHERAFARGQGNGPMAGKVTRRQMETWLLDNGFRRLKGGMSGHVLYERQGVKVTLPGHGPQDLTKKHVALILRSLDEGGFDREQVRRELGG